MGTKRTKRRAARGPARDEAASRGRTTGERADDRRDDDATTPPPGLLTPQKLARIGAVVGAIAGVVGVLWYSSRDGASSGRPVDGGAATDATRPPAHLTEAEPNDTEAQAQPLTWPVEVAGALKEGDRDLYRVEIVDHGGFLLAAWVDGPAGVSVSVRPRGGAVMARASAPERISELGVSQGTFVIAVEGSAPGAVGDGGAAGAPAGAPVTGAYRLHVDVEPWQRGSDWEPNEDPEHAQEMLKISHSATENARYRARGRWSRAGDVDCYRFPLAVPPQGAVFRIQLKPPPAVRARLWVLDSGNREAKIAPRWLASVEADEAGQELLIPALGGRAWEPAYSVCTATTAGESAGQFYELTVTSYTPTGPFEFEPNDDAKTASALPRDVELRGHLTKGDVDYYRISAGPPGLVGVRATLPTGVDAEVSLLDAAEHELESAQGQGGQTLRLAHSRAAFVRLQPRGHGDTKATYSLSAHTVPTGQGHK